MAHTTVNHYNDVIITTIASQITSLTVVYSTVYSDADQRKHQSSASLAFVWGIHRDRWIPRTKGQLRGKCFHLMTSSCKHKGPFSYFIKSPQSNTRIKFHHDVICFSIYCVRSNSSRKHFSPGRQTFDNVLALFVLLTTCLLSGVPDYFDRNKISSGGDLSHYSSTSLY